jgi:hypothetical protein
VLATNDLLSTQKRFLSRTARYSGLLNVLEFEEAELHDTDKMKNIFTGANSWVAFNLSEELMPSLVASALDAGVQRAVVTTSLPINRINETSIDAFEDAKKAFETAGRAFTGVRHGQIIEGDENNPYEIVNASIPCLENTVERGSC